MCLFFRLSKVCMETSFSRESTNLGERNLTIFRRNSDGEFIAYEETTLSSIGKLERDLENWLTKNSEFLFPHEGVFLFARQSSHQEAGVSDLLGLDERGDLFVVELKRGCYGRQAIAQALDYVSELERYGYDELQNLWRDTQTAIPNIEDAELSSAHKKFHRLSSPLVAEDFNRNQHIVLVSAGPDERAERIASWLESSGVPVYQSNFSVHQSENDEELLLDLTPVEVPTRKKFGVKEDDYWLNSDEKHHPGSWAKMIEQEIACTYGPLSYGKKLQPLEVGSRIFLYLSGTGIVAEGEVTEPWSGEVNEQSVTDDNVREYSVRVDWKRSVDSREQALSPSEIRDAGNELFVPTLFNLDVGVARRLSEEFAEKVSS